MSFDSYVAKDRHFKDFRFDFHIVNETAQSWYDGSPNQWMPEREWCVTQLRPGMTVVDCGAHHGMLSLIFANAVGPQGRVLAYEALPENAEVIDRNAGLNNVRNIVVRPVGVGAAKAQLQVHFNASNTVVADANQGLPPNDAQTIEIVALDEDIAPGLRVDFIKIDVEGHDLSALQGMQRILAQRPIIDLELHNFIFPDRQATLASILAMLQPLGYRWQLLGEIGGTPENLGQTLDLARLAGFDNPHLFGLPG